MDAFSAQIVQLVRTEMSDEAILALVKNQLGAVAGAVAVAAGAAPARRGRGRGRPRAKAVAAPVKRSAPAKRRGAKRARRSSAPSAERQETLVKVEKVVKGASGLSASEVAKVAGIPQPRAASALKELKLAKRIHQGGDRRFARYAGDAKTAEQASLSARKTASGPVTKRGGKRGKR